MALDRTALAIVFDPDFGAALRPLAGGMPVQVIDSPTNRPVIEALWTDRRTRQADHDVTVFRFVPGVPPDEHLTRILRSVLRPGAAEDDPPPSTVDVVGLPLTALIEKALTALGAGRCRATANGFKIAFGHPSPGADKAGS